MSVVRVPPVLRAEAGGAREVEASGSTVRELLEDLRARVLETPVREGATVILLPAMAGGC
jgi:molybdopterin converting factor small subunit